MENFTMLRFMLSHPSTERSSAMRLSSSCGSKVGIAMPGSGTPRPPQRRRNISKGSCGGASSGLRPFLRQGGDHAHFGLAAAGALVAESDEREVFAVPEE